MKDPVLVAFAALFMVLGLGAAYFLVRGLRDGRIVRRLYYPYPKQQFRDSRDVNYAYRSHMPGLFWTEIGMQVLAVAVSIVVVFILMTAP
ncbi:MAG: hypothetical protein WDM91_04495 [Rhizomicrobium sp.]